LEYLFAAIQQMPRRTARSLIAHELCHVYLFVCGKHTLDQPMSDEDERLCKTLNVLCGFSEKSIDDWFKTKIGRAVAAAEKRA
jgi:hypothetical protein